MTCNVFHYRIRYFPTLNLIFVIYQLLNKIFLTYISLNINVVAFLWSFISSCNIIQRLAFYGNYTNINISMNLRPTLNPLNTHTQRYKPNQLGNYNMHVI